MVPLTNLFSGRPIQKKKKNSKEKLTQKSTFNVLFFIKIVGLRALGPPLII